MFATFRHWVVMAVAYKRNKMYVRVVVAGLLAVISSPVDFFIEGKRFLTKIAIAAKSSDVDEGVKKKDECI